MKDGEKKGLSSGKSAGKSNKRHSEMRSVESSEIEVESSFPNMSFRNMFDSLPAAIYTTDTEGRITYFNPAAVEFSGYIPKLGMDKWCVSWKLYRSNGTKLPHGKCSMAVALKEGRSVQGEIAVAEKPDGERISFEAYPSPIYDDEGKIIGGINMLVDISGRVEAEQALRKNEQRLSSKVSALKRLHALSTELLLQKDIEAALKVVMKASAELMNADKASVQIFDGEKNVLQLVDTIGFDQSFINQFRTVNPDGFTSCAACLKRNSQIFIEDCSKTTEFSDFGQMALSYGMSSVLSIPLIGGNGQNLGVFSMYWAQPHRPRENMLQLLDLYTQQAARLIDRTQAEKELRESEEKYRSLFDSIDEGFCIIKVDFDKNQKATDFKYLEANSSFEEQTGLKSIEGKYASDVIPDLEDVWYESYGKVALTGKPLRFENFANGLRRWFNVYAFRIGEPKECKVALLFKDITELKEEQQEREALLREVETEKERLIEIFHKAPSFMCILRGPDYVFERTNDLYMQLIGDRQVIGKPVREVIPELEGQGFIELLDQVYETGEPFVGSDMQINLQRGPGQIEEERYLDFVYQPLRDSDGTISGIFAQGLDLTEQRRAKEQLKAINETLEERVEERTEALLSYQDQLRHLASQLSRAEEDERQRLASELHDNLGQILAVSRMELELLQKSDDPDQMEEGFSALTKLIDDAIRYTRELMSDLKPPPGLDKEELGNILTWLAQKMEKHGLDVTILDDEQPKPVDEEIRLTILQSVRELLFNVVKHARSQKACIKVSYQGKLLEVIVMDEGIGFDPGKLDHSDIKSGGFGLFNIRERMNLLGGSLKIVSNSGRGTQAIIRVPVRIEEKSGVMDNFFKFTGINSSDPVIDEQSGEKVKVLLADDHKMMRTGLKKMIEQEKDLVVIAEASNGKEAVELTHKLSPNIILMDVDMPVMNGVEATRRIKVFARNTRIIGLSLHEDPEVERSMRQAGASVYLTKSDVFETLCATIRSEAKMGKNNPAV